MAGASFSFRLVRRDSALWAAAGVALAIATIAGVLLHRGLPDSYVAPWLYLPVVLAVTLYRGMRRGITLAIAASVLMLLFTVEPLGLPVVRSTADFVELAIGIVGLVAIAVLVARLNEGRVAMVRDRTRRDEQLHAREQQSATLESMSDAFAAFDREWRYTYLNEAAARLAGRGRDDLVGNVLWEVFPEVAGAAFYESCRRAMTERVPVELDTPILLRGRWMEVRIYATAEGVSIYMCDVTQRRQAQELREQLAAIVESTGDAVMGIGLDGAITTWNASAARLFGFTREEAAGRPITLIMPPDRMEEFAELSSRVRTGNPIEQYQTVRLDKNGRGIDVALTVSPIYDTAGAVIGSSAVARDISEQRRLQRELQESHDYLQAILQCVADGITVQNRDGELIYLNDIAARDMGFASASEVLPMGLAEVMQRYTLFDEDGCPFPPGQLPGRQALDGKQPPEAVVRWRDTQTGDDRWTIIRALPSFDEHGNVRFAVNAFQDVTHIKRGELAMRTLAEASQLLAGSLDYETTLQNLARMVVPDFADWCAVHVCDSGGTPRLLALAHADPAKAAAVQAVADQYIPHPEQPTGYAKVIRTGEPELIAAVSDELIAERSRNDDDLRLLRELGPHSSICVPLPAAGGVLGAMTFVRAESGRRYTVEDVALAEEIARRGATAIENARLYRASREALRLRDEFLVALSHDLRTPLTTVKGLIQLSIRRAARLAAPEGEQLSQHLRMADGAVTRVNAMINDVLDLTRLDSGRALDLQREPTDLVALARRLVDEHQQTAPRHQLRIESDLPALTGNWDAERLDRVIGNLLSNAVKYSPDGGAVTVLISATTVEGNEWAVLSVRDAGLGIPAAELPHIFERYRRGSNVAGRIQGVGIGLAGARQIVEQHGGTMAVASVEGTGSTFEVRLPCELRSTAGPEAEPAGGAEPVTSELR